MQWVLSETLVGLLVQIMLLGPGAFMKMRHFLWGGGGIKAFFLLLFFYGCKVTNLNKVTKKVTLYDSRSLKSFSQFKE